MSEVGFEPTPPMETRILSTLIERKLSLESGALDRSAILTAVSDVPKIIPKSVAIEIFLEICLSDVHLFHTDKNHGL